MAVRPRFPLEVPSKFNTEEPSELPFQEEKWETKISRLEMLERLVSIENFLSLLKILKNRPYIMIKSKTTVIFHHPKQTYNELSIIPFFFFFKGKLSLIPCKFKKEEI